MNVDNSYNVATFPMGPHMMEWMEVGQDAYRGYENPNPSNRDLAGFSAAFLQRLEDAQPSNADHLCDLLEELVGMNLPLLALKLVDANLGLFPDSDFRAQLHLGNAAMMSNDLARAEIAFVECQKLIPEEPAPYINLAQIYCHDGLLEKAKVWCRAGLDAEADNPRLWEIMAWIEQNLPEQKPIESAALAAKIEELAKSLNSWVGRSLACDLLDAEDVLTKVSVLESFWHEGCRTQEFVIEFTALLGMAGQYDRILTVIWQFQKQSKEALPWRLSLHAAQANLGLGRPSDARELLVNANKNNDLPDSAVAAIQGLLEEAAAEVVVH